MREIFSLLLLKMLLEQEEAAWRVISLIERKENKKGANIKC